MSPLPGWIASAWVSGSCPGPLMRRMIAPLPASTSSNSLPVMTQSWPTLSTAMSSTGASSVNSGVVLRPPSLA